MTSEDPNAHPTPEAPSAADGLPVDFAEAAALLPSGPQPGAPARLPTGGAPVVTTTDPEGARRAVARAGQALPSAPTDEPEIDPRAGSTLLPSSVPAPALTAAQVAPHPP